MRGLAEIVRDVVANCRVEYAGPDKRCYRVDYNKIARVLHEYKPHWPARRRGEELYQDYKKGGLTPEEFEGERFMRIAHLKWLMKSGLLGEDYRWIS